MPFIVVSGAPQPPTPAQKASSPPGATAHVAKANMKQLGAVIQFALQKAEPPHREPAGRDSYVLGMKHLVSVVQRLSLARNLESIMAIVRRAVRDLTGAEGATFVLRDADQCYYADEDAISPLWKGQRFPLERLHQRLGDAATASRRSSRTSTPTRASRTMPTARRS